MMTTPLQRDVFLSGEGDAWFQRNRRDQPLVSATDDPLLPALLDIPLEAGAGTSVVEVGCGQGLRLHTLAREKGWLVHGLDPSAEAVAAATELGVDARVGTAEQLPYASRSVDLLILVFASIYATAMTYFKLPQKHIVFSSLLVGWPFLTSGRLGHAVMPIAIGLV